MKVFVRRYRSHSLALAVASLIGVFAFSVDMTFTAEATTDETETGETTPEKTTSSLDLDSLYAAKAAEESFIDTNLSVSLDPSNTINGHVSWYGPGFHGRRTANGERFDMNVMTAAHKKLPFNTIVRVVDNRTGEAILVRINDRGPYIRGRVIDLSKEAAARLGMRGRGTTSGTIEIYQPTPVDGRITSLSSDSSAAAISFVTYDAEARGARPNGWSVSVGSFGSFDAGINLYDELRATYDEVFYSRVILDGREEWHVSVGLYGSRHLGEGLLVDLLAAYGDAELITFENGLPVRLDRDRSGVMARL